MAFSCPSVSLSWIFCLLILVQNGAGQNPRFPPQPIPQQPPIPSQQQPPPLQQQQQPPPPQVQPNQPHPPPATPNQPQQQQPLNQQQQQQQSTGGNSFNQTGNSNLPSSSQPSQPLKPRDLHPASSSTSQDEFARVKDESTRRVLMELATPQTPSQMNETKTRLAQLVGPLFVQDFDERKEEIFGQGGNNGSIFPERILSAIMEIQGEEIKAHILQRDLEDLRAGDFGILPVSLYVAFLDSVLGNLTGTKLAAPLRTNFDDTLVAYKMASALEGRRDEQDDFLQSLGGKITPDVQKIIITQVLKWWGDPNQWKDRELSLLTTAGDPLLSYLPPSCLETLDDELADRFINVLGGANEIGKIWWTKPMSIKKVWFELAKGARYFGAVHEWSFRRMQKLSFLLEGASPDDLKKIPQVPEIKGLIIGNHYTELQARVVFDTFYTQTNLNQEDLNEFQLHVLKLTPTQIQRFDLADSFSTLDDMMILMEMEDSPSYPTLLQISYFMWPIVNSSSGLTMASTTTWQKRELSQMGKMLFTLPKQSLLDLPQELINWDSNILQAIRSRHLSQWQKWHLTSLILNTIDDRFKPDYVFMIPPPFQKGIPSHNISQVLLVPQMTRPEVLRALIEESTGMLKSQQAVISQRIRQRFGEPSIIRIVFNSEKPSELFEFISPRHMTKNIQMIVKTIMEIPEIGPFGPLSVQAKLLPQNLLSIWLSNVRDSLMGTGAGERLTRWTVDDLRGRSLIGATNKLNYAILGLTCTDLDFLDPLDIPSVLLYLRTQIYALRISQPDLEFPMDLRICAIEKVLKYLEIKNFLNGTQADQASLLSGLDYGDINSIGGEVLSAIPQNSLLNVQTEVRRMIVEEIGQLEMLELFSFAPLKQLQWYGNLLLNDIHRTNATSHGHKHHPEDEKIPVIEPASGDPSDELASAPPLDSETVLKMGNLLCYANNVVGDIDWSKQILKDVLEGKTGAGEKTCCMPNFMRIKWFNLLQAAYGTDTSTWNENDLVSIGDLLVSLPPQDLQKISLDAFGKAVSPMVRQSGFSQKIHIPGEVKKIPFIRACRDALGGEGDEFYNAYKLLMKKTFQAAQWMVNTVKPTVDLINVGMDRTGRLPRWAEYNVVSRPKRQINFVLDSPPKAQSSGPDPSQPNPPPPTGPVPVMDGNQKQQPVMPMPSSNPSAIPPPAVVPPPQQQQMSMDQSQFPQQMSMDQSQFPQPQQQAPMMGQQQPPSGPPVSQDINFPIPPNPQLMAQQQRPPMNPPQGPPPRFGRPPQQQQFQQPPPPPQQQFPVPQSQPGTVPQQIQMQPQPPIQPQPTQQQFPPRNVPDPTLGQNPVAPPPQQQQQQPQPLPPVDPSSLAPVQPPPAPIPAPPVTQQQQQQMVPVSPVQVQPPPPPPVVPEIPFEQPSPFTESRFMQQQQQQPAPIVAQKNQQQFFENPQQSPRDLASQQNQFNNAQLNSQSPNQPQQQPPVPQQKPSADQQQQQQFRQPPIQQQGPQQFPSNQQQQLNAPQQNQQQFNPQQGQQQIPNNQQQQQFNSQGQQQIPNNQQQQFNSQGQQLNPNNQQQQFNQFNAQQQPGFPPGQQQFPQNQFRPQQFPQGPQGPQGPNNQFNPQGGQNPNFGPNGVQRPPFNNNFPQQFFVPENQTNPLDGKPGDSKPSDSTTDQEPRSVNGTEESTAPTIAPIPTASDNFGQLPEVSCHGIKAAGPAVAGLTIEDLNKLSGQDIFDCIETLGQVDWDGEPQETKFAVLKLIRDKSSDQSYFNSLDPLKILELGNLVTALSFKPEGSTGVSDISKLDLTIPDKLDTISLLGSHITQPEMLQTIAEKFNSDNRIFPGFATGIARPDNLRITVISLQNIICGFSDKIVNSIFETDASLFLDVSPTLGKLEGCSPDILTTLAAHAVRPGNYGPPRIWTREDLNTIGIVFAGLKPEAISTLSPDSLSGLTPLAIRSTPAASLQALSSGQMSKMSYMAARAIKKDLLATLSPEQVTALNQVLSIDEKIFNIDGSSEFEQRDVHEPTNKGDHTGGVDDSEVTIEVEGDEESSKVKHHDPTITKTDNSTTHHVNITDDDVISNDPSQMAGSSSAKLLFNTVLLLLAQLIYYLN